jgi:exopolysaccharide biosynthesis polyprenyl glycosylphosphotransferase
MAMAVDTMTVLLAFALASLSASPPDILLATILPVLFAVTFLIACTSLGLYRIIGSVPVRVHAMLAVRAYLSVIAVILIALFLSGSTREYRDLLMGFFPLMPALYIISWAILRAALQKLRARRFGSWRTLVLGVDTGMHRLLARVGAFPQLGYTIVRIEEAARTSGGFLHFDPVRVEQSITDDAIELVLLSSSHIDASLEQLEAMCRERRVEVRIISRESDELFIRSRIYDLAGIPVVWPEPRPVEQLKRLVKRGFDIVASMVLLVILAPVLLCIALVAKMESRGPVIFRQKRSLSGDAEPFEFFKFRSMVHESKTAKESLAGRNESDGLLFKIRDDPRLTRVGRYIRRHSLDELPQLFNVLRGDMSLVGPRPLPVEDFSLLSERDHLEPYVRQRARARPGMTGLWQISGRSDLGFREMVLLDLYYVQHQNILFDLEILFRTLPVVVFGKGAY